MVGPAERPLDGADIVMPGLASMPGALRLGPGFGGFGDAPVSVLNRDPDSTPKIPSSVVGGPSVDRTPKRHEPRQAIEKSSKYLTVKKHTSMGCAVLSFRDHQVREAIMKDGDEVTISGVRVQLQRHKDKETGEDVPTDVFAAWGRKVEKNTPLSEGKLLSYFEAKHRDLLEKVPTFGCPPSEAPPPPPGDCTGDAAKLPNDQSSEQSLRSGAEPEPEGYSESSGDAHVADSIPKHSVVRKSPVGSTHAEQRTRVMVSVRKYTAEASGYISVSIGDIVEVVKESEAAGEVGCAWPVYIAGRRLSSSTSGIVGRACPKKDGPWGWLPSQVLWERYQDEHGRPWLLDPQTGSWRWESA